MEANSISSGRTVRVTSQVIDKLAVAGGWFSGLAIMGMAFSTAFEIVARYVFNRPTIWSLELCEYLLVMAAFLGAGHVMKEGRHIIVDFFISYLNKKTLAMLGIVNLVITLAFAAILLWYGGIMFGTSFAFQEASRSVLRFPLWIPKATIPIGGAILLLQVLKTIFHNVSRLNKLEHDTQSRAGGLSLQNPIILLPLYIAIIIAEVWLLKSNPILAMILMLFTLMFGGVPIFASLGMIGCIALGVLYSSEAGMLQAPLIAFKSMESFTLSAIPLFILAATILARGALINQLYDIGIKFAGHLPGGLAIASVIASAIFGFVCGSTVAASATIGLVAIPMMVKHGYDKELIYGTVAIGGTLAAMIPPGLGMIIYGSLTDVSVGKLFMAGIIPGIYEAITIAILILFLCRGGRRYTPLPPAPWKERFASLAKGIWGLLAPVIILGGIYTGVFTATEAAAIAVVYALLVSILVLRSVGWKEMQAITLDTVRTTVMLLLIIVGAMIFGHMTTYVQIPQKFMALFTGFSPWGMMIMVNVLIIILGCFLEGASLLLIVVPVVYPVLIHAMGFDPVWFGIVFIANIELALITPPVGMNLFVIQGITQDKLSTVVRGAFPFMLLQLFNLAVIIAFPMLALWLPNMMKW